MQEVENIFSIPPAVSLEVTKLDTQAPAYTDIPYGVIYINSSADWDRLEMREVLAHEELHINGYEAIYNAKLRDGSTLIACYGSICVIESTNGYIYNAINLSEGTVSYTIGGDRELQRTFITNLSTEFGLSRYDVEQIERNEGAYGWCIRILNEFNLNDLGNCTADMLWQLAQFPDPQVHQFEDITVENFRITFEEWLAILGQGENLGQ